MSKENPSSYNFISLFRCLGLGAVLLGVSLWGCGSNIADPEAQPNVADPEAGRLSVNDRLREGCARFANDSEIEFLIIVVEDGRLEGHTRSEGMIVAFDCESTACLTCLVLIVDQVFGR